jgi:hypothetical protein
VPFILIKGLPPDSSISTPAGVPIFFLAYHHRRFVLLPEKYPFSPIRTEKNRLYKIVKVKGVTIASG